MASFAKGEFERLEEEYRKNNEKLLKRVKLHKYFPPYLLRVLRKIKNG